MSGIARDGTELLESLDRIAEAAEQGADALARIAEHLTKQGMGVVPGGAPAKPRRHYNEEKPQPEQTDGERIQRPKAASQS